MSSSLRDHWLLDPRVDFLNHGSFGACPRPVLDRQDELRRQLEFQPVRFMVRELEALLDDARSQLAAFLGARADDLVAVSNATTGVNAVVRSLPFSAGDEVLVTDHGYGACTHAARQAVESAGGTLVTAQVPFPLSSSEEVLKAVLDAATPRTRLALIDHVTSPTGLVFPIAQIVTALAERGIDTLVDGAHGPGMLDLDLDRLGAAYYTGNCHKWMCAPKGAAFLHVRTDRQDNILPAVISHGHVARRPDRRRFHDRFDWPGTIDPTAFLSVPTALDFLGGLLPGGWHELREQGKELTLIGRQLLCDALNQDVPCPEDMIASMASVVLPAGSPLADDAWCMETDPIWDILLEKHRIEVPVFPWPAPPERLLRISSFVYTEREQFERLSRLLPEVLQQAS